MKIILNLIKFFGWGIIVLGTTGLVVALTSDEINIYMFVLPVFLFVAGGITVSWSRKRLNPSLIKVEVADIEPKKTIFLSVDNWFAENTWFGPTFLLSLIIIPVILLFMFADRNPEDNSLTAQNSSGVSQKMKESIWIEKGKEAVRNKLKDANSATFRNVYFHRGADNIPMTCGEVNSKNSFGGFTGYQSFVSAGKDNLTFLQEQVEDFNTIWNKFCR